MNQKSMLLFEQTPVLSAGLSAKKQTIT